MEPKPKKPSTYDMLKRLDSKVHQNKPQRKDGSCSRSSSDYKRRRSVSPRNHDSRKRRSESPSRRQDHSRRPSKRIPEIVIDDTDYDIPDRSFGDLYCKACDSHMNSDQMWEAHIQGKRHQKHIKKGEGQGDMKYEILDEDPLILPDIKKSSEPIIGLQHCCEIRRSEGKPVYQCFLCSSNVPNGLSLMEHVVGLKHRMAYLKEHDPVKHDLIDKTNLKKGMIEPVVAECIRLHQDKHGTGRMQVKLDRSVLLSAPSNQNYKKPSQDNFDNTNRKRDDSYRRSIYPDERDDDFRYNKQQDYQRPHFSEDSRYPSDDMRDRRYHSPPRYSRSPPIHRRSPIPYERGYYATPTATAQPSSYGEWPSAESRQKNEDLPSEQRGVRQQQAQNSTSSSSSNLNLFQSLLKIIETMPSMMFLEIVLHKVENMDPSETELAMLQKIGNHMISIVMNRKLQKLSPDLLGKYQSKPEPMEEQSNKSANNLNSLMSLVSQFNSTKSSSSSSNWSPSDKPSANVPAFMTQTPGSFYNSWGSSSNTEIPGLTLSSTAATTTNQEYPQRTCDAPPSSWSDSSFRNSRYDSF